MRNQRFQITEDGQVWEAIQPWTLENGSPAETRYRQLGHISCLMNDMTATGRAVQDWWQAWLASDDPMEYFQLLYRRKKPRTRVPVTPLVANSCPDQADAEALAEQLVAD